MAAPKVDILVNLLLALQPFAGDATTLPLNDADQPLDYSRLIGTIVLDHENRLFQITSSLNTLYSYTTVLQTQMATIIANGLIVPQISLPVIMPDAAYYNIEVVVTAIGTQFDTLRKVTGLSTELTDAIGYQDKIYSAIGQTLEAQISLSDGVIIMHDLPDWQASPITVADTIKNLWITVNDMRKAIQTTLTPSFYADCAAAAIVVNFNTYIDIPNNRITLYFLGNSTIPSGFIDTDENGASVRITDGSSTPNVYATYANVSDVNKSVSGITIDLQGTNINLYTTLSILVTYSFTNGKLICTGTRTNSVPTTISPCTQITLTPTSTTSIMGVFTPAVYGAGRIVTYKITTYSNSDCSTAVGGTTITYTNPAAAQLTYTATGLTTLTTYYVRMEVAVGGLASAQCTLIQSVKTL